MEPAGGLRLCSAYLELNEQFLTVAVTSFKTSWILFSQAFSRTSANH